MNVKCPNCRFKFDVNPTNVSTNNEVNCTCPRCGMTFTNQYIAPSSNIEEPVPPIDAQVPPVVSEEEADLYYAVMKRMKAGQHEEAGIYLKKLLAMKPDEPIYQEIKKQLDGIKRSYLLATKYISSGQLNLAELYVNDLLKINPNDPMYLGLKEDLDEAKRIENQKKEELRRQEDARRFEEERRREEARLEEERRLHEAWLEAERKSQQERFISYLESDEIDKAQSQLDQLLEEYPDDPVYLNLKNRLEEYRLNDLQQKELLRRAEEELKEEERKGKAEESERLKQVLYGENDDSSDGSSSGCMVAILALIVTLASIALL